MLTAIQDGDAIFSHAIKIASAEERNAYIAQACGNDADLRRQIEERVAEHFQTHNGSDKPTLGTANSSLPSRSDPKKAEAPQAHQRGESTPKTGSEGPETRKYSPTLVAFVAILMLAAAVGGGVLAFWGVRAEKEARKEVQQALEEREQALKNAEQYKQQRNQAEKARKALADERDQAVEDEKTAKDSAEVMKSVVSFFQRNVLSAGRSVGWSGGQGKDVTLRKAVDAADAKIDAAFADRPLAEASIREMLGSTYLDLEAPELAVKEYERAVALREARQGDDYPETVACRNQLEVAYRLSNRPLQADRLLDPDKNSSSHASALAIRGSILLAKKKHVEAEQKLRECLAIRQKLKPDDWSTCDAKSLLGEALLEQKKYAEAEPLLLSGYEGMKKREAKIPAEERFRLTKQLERLVRLYEAWGKEDEANKWSKELAQAPKIP